MKLFGTPSTQGVPVMIKKMVTGKKTQETQYTSTPVSLAEYF